MCVSVYLGHVAFIIKISITLIKVYIHPRKKTDLNVHLIMDVKFFYHFCNAYNYNVISTGVCGTLIAAGIALNLSVSLHNQGILETEHIMLIHIPVDDPGPRRSSSIKTTPRIEVCESGIRVLNHSVCTQSMLINVVASSIDLQYIHVLSCCSMLCLVRKF